MILFPEKEYSQGMLESLNDIAYSFYEFSVDYLLEETDGYGCRAELEDFLPSYLIQQDAERCLKIIKELYRWVKDEHYHLLSRVHEYALMRSIHSNWLYFNDLPNEESAKLRNSFYSVNNKLLSEWESKLIEEMRDSELTTMQAFFENMNFGEIELLASLYEEATFTFLRFPLKD